mgnify:CR=1 FL=1
MRNIIIFLVLVTIGISANAQTRGFYGTLQPFSTFPAAMLTHTGASAPGGTVDTLRYSYDSTTGAAILQGSQDGTTWQAITGLTSLCTDCVGASKTITNAKGLNKYTWSVGEIPFAYWRIRLVGSRSTDTTVVTAQATYAY